MICDTQYRSLLDFAIWLDYMRSNRFVVSVTIHTTGATVVTDLGNTHTFVFTER